jgi:hypothetical protein
MDSMEIDVPKKKEPVKWEVEGWEWPDLPDEVMLAFFEQVPFPSRWRLTQVCKWWYDFFYAYKDVLIRDLVITYPTGRNALGYFSRCLQNPYIQEAKTVRVNAGGVPATELLTFISSELAKKSTLYVDRCIEDLPDDKLTEIATTVKQIVVNGLFLCERTRNMNPSMKAAWFLLTGRKEASNVVVECRSNVAYTSVRFDVLLNCHLLNLVRLFAEHITRLELYVHSDTWPDLEIPALPSLVSLVLFTNGSCLDANETSEKFVVACGPKIRTVRFLVDYRSKESAKRLFSKASTLPFDCYTCAVSANTIPVRHDDFLDAIEAAGRRRHVSFHFVIRPVEEFEHDEEEYNGDGVLVPYTPMFPVNPQKLVFDILDSIPDVERLVITALQIGTQTDIVAGGRFEEQHFRLFRPSGEGDNVQSRYPKLRGIWAHGLSYDKLQIADRLKGHWYTSDWNGDCPLG